VIILIHGGLKHAGIIIFFFRGGAKERVGDFQVQFTSLFVYI
jgi:hypothetical protein